MRGRQRWRPPFASVGVSVLRRAGAGVGFLDAVDDVVTDGQRRAAVVLLAHHVELALREYVAAGTVPAEAVDDLVRTSVDDRRAGGAGGEEEELPVAGLRVVSLVPL